MSIFDNQRISGENFKIDAERMRAGWYSDKYFENITGMLTTLAQRGYRFEGFSQRLHSLGIDASDVDIGNIEAGLPG